MTTEHLTRQLAGAFFDAITLIFYDKNHLTYLL